ncbi:MAG: ABC transporter permease [Coriobacteriia bacterium]|nr:ABC transporter permease [Coriobacteriia bacterium]MCL2606662.1 ABC transporter permease [Coriobacteriia bacterium]
MHIFRTALRIFFSRPVYLLTYLTALSAIGIFMSMGIDDSQNEFEEARPTVAIINRDQGNDFSEAFADFVASRAEIVELADDRQSMQDAVAQNYASYIMIIPAGYGDEFASAAAHGMASPVIDTVISQTVIFGALMDPLVNDYLSAARLYLQSGTAATPHEAAQLAKESMEDSAVATVMQYEDSTAMSVSYLGYMTFASYTILLSVIISVSVLLAAFNRTDVRKRDLAAPVSRLKFNMQLAAACFVAMLFSWAVVGGLGLVVYRDALVGVSATVIILLLVSLLAFSLVALSLAFLLGQILASETTMNVAGNIIGLVFAFMGGIFIPTDFMPDIMQSIAQFVPTYYYGNAITELAQAQAVSAQTITPLLGNLGMLVLFAMTFFAVALALSRLRLQSSAS